MKFFKRMGTAAFMIMLLGTAMMPLCHAVEESGGQKHNGVIYNIADDRQVEKVGGIYEPEGLDKYMKRRFDTMDAKLNDIQGQLEKMAEQMMVLLKKIEENAAREDKDGDVLVSGNKAAETRAVKPLR